MLRECYEMNKEIKSPWNFCGIYYNILYKNNGNLLCCKKYTASENSNFRKTK